MAARLNNISTIVTAGLTRQYIKRSLCSSSSKSAAEPGCRTLPTLALPKVVIDKKAVGKITLRPMSANDLSSVNELIKERKLIDFAESDIYSMVQSPDFLGLVIENEAKEIIAFNGYMEYADNILTSGQHVVGEKFRGGSLGMDMVRYGAEYFTYGRTWYGLGYQHLEEYYDRVGIYFDKSFGTFHRLQGRFSDEYLAENVECDADFLTADKVDFRELSVFDERIHTKPRHAILRGMCFHPTTISCVAVKGKTVVGYGLLRRSYLSYKIAPVFAENPAIAQVLFQKLATSIPEGSLCTMIVCSNNESVADFIKKNNFEVVNSLWRFVSVKDFAIKLPIDFSKVFTITNSNFALT